MKKIGVFCLLVMISSLMLGCMEANAADELGSDNYKSVETEIVKLEKTDDRLLYSGQVVSSVEKNISFKSAGRVKEILVEEGESVEVGQLIAKIDSEDVKLQVQGMASDLLVAEKDIKMKDEALKFNEDAYNDAKILFDANALSKSALDSSFLAYENARLAKEMSLDSYNRLKSESQRLNTMLSDGSVRADQVGIIDQINVETFEYVSPGQTAFVIRSPEQMVVTYISESDVQKINLSNKVTIDAHGKIMTGKIIYIDDAADPQTHSYRTEILIEDSIASNGMIATLNIFVGKIEGIWIPVQSVQSSSIDYVYIVKDQRAVKRAVDIIGVNGDMIHVIGLDAGEELIVTGMKSLVEGMLVKASE